MATQIDEARSGRCTEALQRVAQVEQWAVADLQRLVADGRAVIPANRNRPVAQPAGIGRALCVKINANLGNSHLAGTPAAELEKLETALRHGADAVMDLSTGPALNDIRRAILARAPVPVGTVPIYEVATAVDDPLDLTPELILQVVDAQAREGVDFMTVHAGLLRDHLPAARRRLAGIVSRGGAILARWMEKHGRENPCFTAFDRILDICRRDDVTLSLGDGLRPGCLADASDEAQFAELKVLGNLVRRCRAAGVQVMVEGPGHVPLDQIEMNMRREAEWCDDAPFYVLGPLVADCAPGYDHITSAIGATLAAYHGAAMLCYVTPMEHLGLPGVEDVRQGVVAYKIAAHAADVALKRPGARDRDDAISRARAAFDWERQYALALDPERARVMRQESLRRAGCPDNLEQCTMCGPKFCSMKSTALSSQ